MGKRFCTGYKTSSLRDRQSTISNAGETALVAVSGTTVKESGPTPCRRCSGQSAGPKTFRPTAAWLQGRTSPELLYLETKWGSLIPFEKVADLLKEVLPVGEESSRRATRSGGTE